MNYITVKTSHYSNELVVLKSRLESEGIECRLKNELTTQVLTHIPSILVELQVPEKDQEIVRRILIEIGELKPEIGALTCKNCGSENLKLQENLLKRIKIFLSVVSVLMGSNVPTNKIYKHTKYKCKNCGHEFYNN